MIGMTRALRSASRVKQNARHVVEAVIADRHAGQGIPLPHENFRYRHFLMPTYLDYVSRVSWADHAVSLETAACLLQMCETQRPQRMLDTGSGYSSYVLRRYALQHGGEVVSVDDDAAWMEKTADYLDESNVGTDGLMTWQDFQVKEHQPFDLIFHDMGTYATRISSLATVSAHIADDGNLVYDDMQANSVRAEARQVTEQAGRRYFSMQRVTGDQIGRYAGLSLRR
jgi:predicted O-methyltransferase YrrM